MMNEFPYVVFLSHSAKDKEVVRELAAVLMVADTTGWIERQLNAAKEFLRRK